jgi:hypothetical protein
MKSYATSTCISASFLLFLKLAKGGQSTFPSDTGAPSQYLFTQQVSVDPVEDSVNLSSETESLAFYSDDYDEHVTDESSSPSVVSSSLLFGDDECLFSLSEALTCNGGDMFAEETTTIPFFDSDYEQDSDDDDDDDGHSSMLSNASLRRSRVSVGGSVPTNESTANGISTSISYKKK